MCNLIIDRFCLGPLAVQGANGQEDSYKQTTENHRPRLSDSFERGQIATKASDSFESGRIATKLTKKRLTKHENEYNHHQRFGVGQGSRSGARGLEPARGQEPIAEALKIQGV